MLLAHVLNPLRWSIGGPHANSGEASFPPTLGAFSPTHILPLGIGQHIVGRPRQNIRNVPLAGTAPTGNRPDQFNPDRINLQVTRDTDGPGQAACRELLTGTPARFKRTGLLVQLSGTKRRNATITGTSPRASVSDTNVWQLAVLPRDEAYCGATPTERSPFFGIAVSSMTSTASLPPTRRSA